MRIVYCIAGTRHSGGMERVLANKANWLVEHGHEVVIVTTDQHGELPFFNLDTRIECYDLAINYEDNNGGSFLNKAFKYPFKQLRHRRKLAKLLGDLKADVVVSCPLSTMGVQKCLKYIFRVLNGCSIIVKASGDLQIGCVRRRI